MRLSIEQVAEAFELRTQRVCYETIALILGTDRGTLRRYMKAAERYGYDFWIKANGTLQR